MWTSSVVHVYHIAGGDTQVIEPIYPWPAGVAARPDWSPDGSLLVLDLVDPTRSPSCSGYCPDERPPQKRRIFTVHLDTGMVQQLIPDAVDPVVADYDDYGAVWSRVTR